MTQIDESNAWGKYDIIINDYTCDYVQVSVIVHKMNLQVTVGWQNWFGKSIK